MCHIISLVLVCTVSRNRSSKYLTQYYKRVQKLCFFSNLDIFSTPFMGFELIKVEYSNVTCKWFIDISLPSSLPNMEQL